MFPIRDENPTINTSIATFLIIGLNIAAWIGVQGYGDGPMLLKSIYNYGVIPGELLQKIPYGTHVNLGPGMAFVVGQPDWLTVFTSMFMHGGWMHLIVNMWFLAIFGDNVEDAMGSVRFIVFYLLCGLGAVAAQMATDPASAIPMVGASGAIGGVMGAYGLLYPKAPVHMLIFFGFFFTRVVVPAYFMMGYWIILQILGGIPALGSGTGGVAFWAHVGGFFTGLILVMFFCNNDRLAACARKRGVMRGQVKKIR